VGTLCASVSSLFFGEFSLETFFCQHHSVKTKRVRTLSPLAALSTPTLAAMTNTLACLRLPSDLVPRQPLLTPQQCVECVCGSFTFLGTTKRLTPRQGAGKLGSRIRRPLHTSDTYLRSHLSGHKAMFLRSQDGICHWHIPENCSGVEQSRNT